MSSSFDLPDVDFLTTGAIGEPGQRVFYIQARHQGRVVTLRLEKAQVAALCRYLENMLENLAPAEPTAQDMALIEPVVPEWVVGPLRVGLHIQESRYSQSTWRYPGLSIRT